MPRPANDDDDDVTDLTGAAAGQRAKSKRGTAQALPVCCALWGCSAGPHLVWNFLRTCARGRALGCRMDALRVARTSFRAWISAVQLLAVLVVDASVSSVLRLARSPCICRLEVCVACARVQVTVSGERLSLGSLRGVCPCLLHCQWRVSIAWGSAWCASVFASPSTISGESQSLWSLCGRHRAAVLLQKVNKNCAACELKLSRVWRAYAADGMRVCTSLSLCSWPWKL